MMTDEQRSFADGLQSWEDADYGLTERETQAIHREIFEYIKQKAVAASVFPTVKIPRGAKAWYVYVSVEPEEGVFDDNFMTESQHEVRKAEHIFYPVFYHKNWRLAMTDIDASLTAGYHKGSLATQTIKTLMSNVLDTKEKVLWNGYDHPGRANAAPQSQGSIDTSSYGILNTSGLTSFHAGTADGDITNAGDGQLTVAHATAALIAAGFMPPYDVFMTPKAYGQYIANVNATTDRSDLSLMMEAKGEDGKTPLIKSLHVSKHLISTVESTTNGKVIFIASKTPNGQPTILLGDEYPAANYPERNSSPVMRGGICLWSGIAGVIHPTAIAVDTVTTT